MENITTVVKNYKKNIKKDEVKVEKKVYIYRHSFFAFFSTKNQRFSTFLLV